MFFTSVTGTGRQARKIEKILCSDLSVREWTSLGKCHFIETIFAVSEQVNKKCF